MDVARPYSAVVPSIDGDVLVALDSTTRPLTGRQVAALARRGSQRAVAATLDRLVEQGLVLREPAGRAYLHTLNRDHLAWPIVARLARLREDLVEALERSFRDWRPAPVHASLFGSAARGDGDSASDIDLLVVRPDDVGDDDESWRHQVEVLASAVLDWTGNHAGLVELSATEFAALRDDAPPILADLREEGIDLFGVSLRKALGPARPRR
jgi:predicted nucleotidyltransferase